MSYRLALRAAALLMAAAVASTLHAAPSATSPAGASAQAVQVGTLKVERHGKAGRPVILIPGLAGGPWVWKETIAELEKSHVVYAVTLAGFDGTPAPSADGNWMDRADASLAQFITQNHLEKPVLVGHSLGGTLALRFAGRHPDLTGAVVAVDGLPIFPGMERVTAEQRAAIAGQLKAKTESATPEEFKAQQLAYMQTVGTLDPATAQRVAPLNARSDQKAVARYMAEDAGADYRPELKAAKAPILEITAFADQDAQMGPVKITEAQKVAYYTSLLADAPQARVIALAPSRHYVMLDQPAAFGKALNDFIGAH
ncbi:alpha/beta hydrolase [Luteibacter aegosomaticola]|uniref:alpha/beta fold hydrolase n=1 Tax=Luteibacter aegosomaticola TaxID=2911538 RepID=UPI001FFADB14|nr:alpha/beta hydrolase [Luteibacter aegosomaticola]UPG89781.1 alpha/beta hydrolase [Luteibacter aegosomaticola]